MTTTILEIIDNAPIPTWFKVGGTAARLARPRSIEQLIDAIELDRYALVLGDGANLLVADEGIDRLVIDLQHLDKTEIVGDLVTAQAGARLPSLVNQTAKAGLAGLHTLAGVPASIGGAVIMNAGGTHGKVSDTLTAVTAVNRSGELVVMNRKDIPFAYRHSGLDELIIVDAVFKLTEADPDELTQNVKDIMHAKKESQPLADRSAGCCFKNPLLKTDLVYEGRVTAKAGKRISAGLVIDRAGCKGLRIGTAEVSPVHANFITVDRTEGKANDVIALIEEVERRVKAAFNIELEREVVIWKSSPVAAGGGGTAQR
ncbi:MAG: UDP-N-acetylmuramate dehydrogenase [Planctomycetota bacterium]